jgi:hypothetical protein
MKALKWIIPIGIVGYLVFKAKSMSNAMNRLSFSLGSVRFNKQNSSFTQVELVVTLNVLNPTNQVLYFNRFAGALYIDEQYRCERSKVTK